MSQKWKKPGATQKRPDCDPKPANSCRYDPTSVHTVSIKESPEGTQWKTDQKGFWGEQLRRATTLNKLTGAAAGFAALYAFIAFLQWRDANHNFAVDQRAWVTPKQPEIHLRNSQLTANVAAGNSGKTPAWNVRYNATIDTSHTPQTIEEFMRSHPKAQTEGSVAVIAPNSYLIMPMSPPDTLAPDLIQKIVNHEKWVYLFGEITYADIFSNQHRTHFCVFYVDESGGPADCPIGNTID